MNAAGWANDILRRHESDLPRNEVADIRTLLRLRDEWLAGYDLFDSGFRGGWLTEDELRSALGLARDGAFGKFSDSVKKAATERLSELAAAT